jgi:hypothetical protein
MATQNEFNIDKSILYVDDPITKITTINGEIKKFYNSDALAQAFKIWLVSGKSEKVRNTGGGVLYPFLGKGLTVEVQNTIRKAIVSGLANDFSPTITIVSLEVVPVPTKNQWVITLQGYSSSLNVGINTYAIVQS